MVFGFDQSKSSGSDGLFYGFFFFLRVGESVEEDLRRVFCEFYEGGVLDCSLNETFSCFIPKKYRETSDLSVWLVVSINHR